MEQQKAFAPVNRDEGVIPPRYHPDFCKEANTRAL